MPAKSSPSQFLLRPWLTGLCLLPSLAFSANIWDGGGANANWDTAANWDDDLVPASGANVTFQTAVTSGATLQTNGNRTIGMLLANGAAVSTLGGATGNVLTVGGGLITFTNAGAFNLSVPTLDIGSVNTTWTGTSTQTNNINSNLTGTGKIIKDGAHNLRLRGNNLGLSGGFDILQGNLNVEFAVTGNSSKALGTGPITFANLATATGSNSVSMNASDANAIWTNNFVFNNAHATQQASLTYQGGGQWQTVALTGAFTTGPAVAAVVAGQRLNFGTPAGFVSGATNVLTEGRYTVSGDWSGFSALTTNGIAQNNRGTLQIDAQQSIAPMGVPYQLQSNDSTRFINSANVPAANNVPAASAKIILNGAFTLGNRLIFGGTSTYWGYNSHQSFGSTQATGTATLSGNVAQNSFSGANFFSLNSGTSLVMSGIVSTDSPLKRVFINEKYSYQNGLTGAAGLTLKTPVGTVLLSGINTFQSALQVKNGTLQIGHANALGGNAVNVLRTGLYGGNETRVNAGASLDLNGQALTTEPILLNGTGAGAAGALINTSGTAASVGVPSGALASLRLTAVGTAFTTVPTVAITGGGGTGATATASLGVTDSTFVVTSGTQTYSQPPNVTIASGGGNSATGIAVIPATGGLVSAILITHPGSGFTTAPTATFAGGTALVAGTLPTAVGNAANFCVNGLTLTAAGTGYVTTPAVAVTGGGGNGAVAAAALSSGIMLESDSAIGGSGDVAISAPIEGAFGIAKVGTGTLTMARPEGQLYTGTTTISVGKLLANNTTGSGTGSGPVSVGASGTLGGTGTVSGAVTVEGTLAAGASVGTLRTGPVTLSATGTLAVELNTSTSTADKVIVTGGFNVTNGAKITLTDLGANDPIAIGTRLVIVDYSTTWNGNNLTLGATPVLDGATITLGANTFKVDYDYDQGGGDLAFTLEAVLTGGNAPPSAVAQSVSTNEDTPLNITLSGTDPENAPLTFVQIGTPTKGVLSGTAPNLTYTPNLNANGPDSFTFKVNDGSITSAPATITISITPINDAPVATAAALSVPANTSSAVPLMASDVDSASLTYTVTVQPNHGTLAGTAPNLVYTPAFNYEGPDSLSFTANDGALTSSVAVISITVVDGNDLPVAAAKTLTTAEDTPASVTLSGSDEEGATLTYQIVATPLHGRLSGTAPALTYTPDTDYSGSDSFVYRVNDGAQFSAAATVSITVTAVNDIPVATPQSVSLYVDVPKAITLKAVDADSASLTYAVVASPTHGSLSGTAPALTYTPSTGYTGADAFTFTANDGGQTSAAATVSITVLPVNNGAGAVVLNEFMASPSPRQISWDAQGVPRLGTGKQWWEVGYSDGGWTTGLAPLGFGFANLGTNLATTMQNRTSQLYVRKSFTASASQAASTNPVTLLVDYNDGFTCFVNGKEVARGQMGGAKTFTYADQTASSEVTQKGLNEYSLGAANTLLVVGENLIAIQAQNSLASPTSSTQNWGPSQTPEFKINAALRLTGAPSALTVQTFDFNAAAGGTETTQITPGGVSTAVSGMRTAGGWLVLGTDATGTAPAGQSASVTGTEVVGIGVGNSGALRYDLTQSAPTTTALISAPEADLSGYWDNGKITTATLANTKLSLRYRVTNNAAFTLALRPNFADAVNVIDNLAVLGGSIAPAPDWDWSTAANRTRTITLPVAGGASTTADSNPAPVTAYGWYSTTDLKDGSFVFKEDNTVASPAGGAAGVLRLSVVKAPVQIAGGTNTWWGWGFPNISESLWNVSTWDATFSNGTTASQTADLWKFSAINAAATADLAKTHLAFRYKWTAGRRLAPRIQAAGAAIGSYNPGYADRIEFPAVTGTGNWEVYDSLLTTSTTGDNGNLGRFVYFLKAANIKSFAYSFNNVDGPTGYVTGDEFLIDDINIYMETPATTSESAAITYATAAGAGRTLTVSGAGVGATANFNGTPTTNFSLGHTGTQNLVLRGIEDTAVGNGGTAGQLRVDVITPATIGNTWTTALNNLRVRRWTPGSVLPADLPNTSVEIAIKAPVGESLSLWAEPGTTTTPGGYANRADFGAYTGTGAWQTIRLEFGTASNVETFRTWLNTNLLTDFSLNLSGSTANVAGTHLQLDDVQVLPWRTYEITLGSGSEGTTGTRFRDALNNANRVAFTPVFTKNFDGNGSLVIDNYSISYTGSSLAATDNLLALGSAAGAWKYHVGLYEPAGGVVDPGLLVLPTGFVIPEGDEGDYDNPTDFSDWVELYNNSNTAANLAGWAVSDSSSNPTKYILPAGAIVPAHGYLVLICDNRDELNAPAGAAQLIHTNFTLSGSGEYMSLADPSGALVDVANHVPKQTFHSTWGRATDGTGLWGYLSNATPAAPNSGPHNPARVGTPAFVAVDLVTPMEGGRYVGPQTVYLTSSTAGAVIRYTTDGSDPLETGGTAVTYTGPLTVTAGATWKDARCYRARAYAVGQLPSSSATHTYFIDMDAAIATVPSMVLSGQGDQTFYKPYGVLAINGGTYGVTSANDLWIPTDPQSYNLAVGHGQPFEREAHMEWYFPNAYYPNTLQQPYRGDLGLRYSASPYSRPRAKMTTVETASPFPANPTEKPSFNLTFRGDLGDSNLSYPIFPGYDIKDFKHLRMRAGKNDINNPFIVDELMRRMWIDMDHIGVKGSIATTWINGQFKGYYNIVERVREPMFQAHLRTNDAIEVRYVSQWVDGPVAQIGVTGTTHPNSWNAVLTALNADLTQVATQQVVASKLDIDAWADYFLLHVYGSAWDWPWNNYAFYRQETATGDSRFHPACWDLEGFCYALPNTDYVTGIANNVNMNTLKAYFYDTPAGQLNGDLVNLFRKLKGSPEWRLKFADRVNAQMFNNGTLDDRDPDGAGPLVSQFKARRDQIVNEFTPVLNKVTGAAVNMAWWDTWTNATTGRRTVMLPKGVKGVGGYVAGHLRDPNATGSYNPNDTWWPETEPVVFSQTGGEVPLGYALSLSSSIAGVAGGATIYYTTNGTDPRVIGGAVSGTALTYSGAITINNRQTVASRAKNNTTGEWSPLTMGSFYLTALSATPAALAVAEIMYNPPGASAAEVAAGFTNNDDFEFIRLINISASPVKLAGVVFTTGISFDFTTGNVVTVDPGASVLAVKNQGAFNARYGHALDATIAGQYTGSLSNSGEQLILKGPDGADVDLLPDGFRDFTFRDIAPWPLTPDGNGPSLLLAAPSTNPDHNVGTNWIASAYPGGLPGGSAPALGYAAWRALSWGQTSAADNAISGPNANPDADQFDNLTEYALGGSPKVPDSSARAPQASLQTTGGQDYLTIEYTTLTNLPDVTVRPVVSSDLTVWQGPATSNLVLLSSTVNPNGTTTWRYRDTAPYSTTPRHYIRLEIQPIP